jgi:hypothetical protein
VFYKIILHSKILLLKVINTIFVGLKKKVWPTAHKTEFYVDGRNFRDLFKIFSMLAGCFETASRRILSKYTCVCPVLCLCLIHCSFLIVTWQTFVDPRSGTRPNWRMLFLWENISKIRDSAYFKFLLEHSLQMCALLKVDELIF